MRSRLVDVLLTVSLVVVAIALVLPWATFEGEGGSSEAIGFRINGGLWVIVLLSPIVLSIALAWSRSLRWALLSLPSVVGAYFIRQQTIADIEDLRGYLSVEGSLEGISTPTNRAADLDGSFTVDTVMSGLGLTLFLIAIPLLVAAALLGLGSAVALALNVVYSPSLVSAVTPHA